MHFFVEKMSNMHYFKDTFNLGVNDNTNIGTFTHFKNQILELLNCSIKYLNFSNLTQCEDSVKQIIMLGDFANVLAYSKKVKYYWVTWLACSVKIIPNIFKCWVMRRDRKSANLDNFISPISLC